MNWEDAHNAIRSKMADLEVGVNVVYDNEASEPPASGRYVVANILSERATQVSFGGSKRLRYPGQLIAQLFDDIGVGDRGLLQLADNIKTAFTSTTTGGVTWRTAFLRRIGPDGHGKYQINVICPFYFDDTT